RVIRAHQPGSEPIDIPETIPNPVVAPKPTPTPTEPAPKEPVRIPGRVRFGIGRRPDPARVGAVGGASGLGRRAGRHFRCWSCEHLHKGKVCSSACGRLCQGPLTPPIGSYGACQLKPSRTFI